MREREGKWSDEAAVSFIKKGRFNKLWFLLLLFPPLATIPFLRKRKKVEKNTEEEGEEPIKKYEKNRIDDELADMHIKELLRYMEEEKPYRDSNLTMPQLAEMVGMNNHTLSQVINARLNKNFYNFVNTYRVDEARRLLKDPDFENRNILEIAFASGFKSKTTFNTLFKKFTGKTPSQYRKG